MKELARNATTPTSSAYSGVYLTTEGIFRSFTENLVVSSGEAAVSSVCLRVDSEEFWFCSKLTSNLSLAVKQKKI